MSERDSLLGEKQRPSRVWGEKRPIEETDETRNLTNDQMQTYQKSKMQDQDRYLDSLGKAVTSTKEIAYGISSELDTHNVIIDDLTYRTEKTSAKVSNTTRRVEKVETQSSTKCMWFCIIFLLFGLIGIVVAASYT